MSDPNYENAGTYGGGANTPGQPPYPPAQPAATPPPRPPDEPHFQVTVTKHTGAAIFWFNQRQTVSGSYLQCTAALSGAQGHNLLLGWWSVGSLLWNPIALSANANSRKVLRQQAEQAAAYSQWWATYYGAGDPNTRVWAPPPEPPARKKWWLWIPVGIVGLIIALFLLLIIIGLISRAVKGKSHDSERSTYGQSQVEHVVTGGWSPSGSSATDAEQPLALSTVWISTA